LLQFGRRHNLRLPAGEPFADRRRCAESYVGDAKRGDAKLNVVQSLVSCPAYRTRKTLQIS
jgi:hypothetical protein